MTGDIPHSADTNGGGLLRAGGETAARVWTLALPDGGEPPPAWAAVLSGDERARLARLRRREDRLAYAAAHALVRAVLAPRLGVAPAEVALTVDAAGKPHPVPPDRGWRFSLSHAKGRVAVALARGRAPGVDVEPLDRPGLGQDLATFAFSPQDCADLDRHGPPESPAWRRAFLDLWTAKEAVAKGLGLGLSLPLARIRITERDARAVLAPGPDVGPALWTLCRRRPGGRHTLALALPGSVDRASVVWTELDPEELNGMMRAGGDREAAASS